MRICDDDESKWFKGLKKLAGEMVKGIVFDGLKSHGGKKFKKWLDDRDKKREEKRKKEEEAKAAESDEASPEEPEEAVESEEMATADETGEE